MNSPDEGWILLVTGKRFYPLDPKVEDIDIKAIAYGLAGEQRFSSQCYPRYTVAQHSYIVSEHCPKDHMLAGLLHDASEGLGLRDIANPIKKMKPFDEYREYEERLMGVIAERFGFEWPNPEVKKIDKRILQDEKKYFMGNRLLHTPNTEPLGLPYIQPWDAQKAEAMFMCRFHELGGK